MLSLTKVLYFQFLLAKLKTLVFILNSSRAPANSE